MELELSDINLPPGWLHWTYAKAHETKEPMGRELKPRFILTI